MDRTAHLPAVDPGAEDDPCVEVQMARSDGWDGVLLFSLADERGRTEPGPLTPCRQCIGKVLENPLWWLLAGQMAPVADSTFQVQAFCPSREPLTAVERLAIRKFFLKARQEILSAYRLRQQRISDD